MRLTSLPGEAQLTYCTNIHAGETWSEISASLDDHVPGIKAAVSPDAALGIGLRLSGAAAAELVRQEVLDRFKDQLERLGAYVFTINAFPYGPFHGTRVKEQVYEPDWRSPERLNFTNNAARILADLLPEAGYGSISTVPGAFKLRAADIGTVRSMAEQLVQAAAFLAKLERSTGRTIALALEPEPCCFLETVDDAVLFFESQLFSTSAAGLLATLTGIAIARAEEMLRLHLGICYDVCHGAVEFEDPVTALQTLRRSGIAVPKIQLSAALRVPDITGAHIARLKSFDTGVYLHQVVVRNGELHRFRDLPEAFEAFRAGAARGEWRVHCHVPLFLSDLDDLHSTQESLLSVLRALRTETFSPHLEVETYTWDVLPDHLKTGSKAQDIARELKFVIEEVSS